MKQLISIIIIIGLVFLAGCQVQTQTKYQCANGEVVDSLDLCSEQTCPELDCSECPKQVETETKEVIKYQCYDGSTEEEFSNCDEPEVIMKYQCQDGTVKDSLKDCDIIQVGEDISTNSEHDFIYKYKEYYDYEKEVLPQLEDEVNTEVVGGYDNYARMNGRIYMVMHDEGGDFNENYRFWAVEINGETGELIKYKEISTDGCPGSPGQCPDSSELWW
jgi:hypothetical protein